MGQSFYQRQLTVNRMLKQFTNQKLFDDIYISYFTSNDESASPALSLSTDEDNNWLVPFGPDDIFCFLLRRNFRFPITCFCLYQTNIYGM